MCLATVSACPTIQIWAKHRKSNNPCVWRSLAPSDLIWVTLGQDTFCIKKFFIMLTVCNLDPRQSNLLPLRIRSCVAQEVCIPCTAAQWLSAHSFLFTRMWALDLGKCCCFCMDFLTMDFLTHCIKQDELYMAIYRSAYGYIWLYTPIYMIIYSYICLYIYIYI